MLVLLCDFMPEFDFKGKKLEYSNAVYFPEEDSFLLAESIQEIDVCNKTCLDLCTGIGIQAMNLLLLGAKKVIASDVSKKAINIARKNLIEFIEIGSCKVIESDLFEKINEKFDLIVCNPPYLPSDEIKVLALDGGKKGMDLIRRFLLNVKNYLNEKGVIYFVVSSLNDLNEVKDLLERNKFKYNVVGKEKFFFEKLMIVRGCLK